MKHFRLIVIVAITILQLAWFTLIAGHYGRFLTSGTFFLTVIALFYLVRNHISAYPWYLRAVTGALVGFLGGIVTSIAIEFGLHGINVFVRGIPAQGIYFTPTALFGWAYGAVLFAIAPSAFSSRSGHAPVVSNRVDSGG